MSTTLRELLARGRRVLTPGSAVPSPRVDRLLDSLRAPATSEELGREDEAVAAFHRARLDTSTPVRSHRASPARTGLKAALASVAAVGLLSTGAAFAAAGHVPWSHHALGASPAAHGTSNQATPTHPGKPTERPSTSGPNPHAYWGLCHAYAAGNKQLHGKALSSPPFKALVAAAGGAHQVASFCDAVPAPRTSHGSSEAPEPSESTEPGEPSESTEPTEGTSSSHPTHPTHPAKPTDGASPSHPTHPAHPSHSPQPTKQPSPTHPTRHSRT